MRFLYSYTKGQSKLNVLWIKKKVKSLFNNKDKGKHPSHTVYQGECDCKSTYVGESPGNLEECVNKHQDLTKFSESARHLSFNWKVITPASSWTLHRILPPPGPYTASCLLLDLTPHPASSWTLHRILPPAGPYTASCLLLDLTPHP